MINAILDYLKDKKVAILGFGLEGKSTYNFLRRYLPEKEITIIDQNETIEKALHKNTKYVLGATYLDNLDEYDVVIKTPGICLIDKDYKCEIVSQFSLLLNLTNAFVIASSTFARTIISHSPLRFGRKRSALLLGKCILRKVF